MQIKPCKYEGSRAQLPAVSIQGSSQQYPAGDPRAECLQQIGALSNPIIVDRARRQVPRYTPSPQCLPWQDNPTLTSVVVCPKLEEQAPGGLLRSGVRAGGVADAGHLPVQTVGPAVGAFPNRERGLHAAGLSRPALGRLPQYVKDVLRHHHHKIYTTLHYTKCEPTCLCSG